MSQLEFNICCYCGDECNPCSQACGRCMRRYIFIESNTSNFELENSSNSSNSSNYSPMYKTQEIIELMKELVDTERLEIISQFCSYCGKIKSNVNSENVNCECLLE